MKSSGARGGAWLAWLCGRAHAKHAAYASAFYTLSMSVAVALVYAWRAAAASRRRQELDDVYYGVQMAYAAIIATQLFTAMLSLFLFYGIYKESASFVVPWVVGGVAGAALELLATVYSNVLRDHVNKQFDAACRAEMAFLVARILLHCVCIWWVLRMYHALRAGVTWSRPAAIEL